MSRVDHDWSLDAHCGSIISRARHYRCARCSAPGLLDSYDAERRPVGEEVVGRTSASGSSVYIVRPDGYLGFAGASIDVNGLVTHLRATFA
jgi:hypothetical protein